MNVLEKIVESQDKTWFENVFSRWLALRAESGGVEITAAVLQYCGYRLQK
jgi:hypothetical protein